MKECENEAVHGFAAGISSFQHLHFSFLLFLSFLSFLSFHNALAQTEGSSYLKVHKQRAFSNTIPAGNYSGITWLGGNRYAVVNDKSAESGFHLFTIDIDSVTGAILHAAEHGFRSSGYPNRDEEGIAFFPQDSSVFISGEQDNQVLEFTLDGQRTGRSLKMPAVFQRAKKNKGLEALTYDPVSGRFFTIPETPLKGDSLSRLQSFGNDLLPASQWLYQTDAPTSGQRKGTRTLGVPALAALPDGRLVVMEREVFRPKKNIGAYVRNTLYIVIPRPELAGQLLEKHQLVTFKTKINLTARSFANYEGVCLGPTLTDGRHVLVLISDSQNQYKGYLKDWLKTIVLP